MLEKGEASLAELGELGWRAALVLSVVAVLVFLLAAAGTRSLGKLGLVAVPAAFALLVSLTIRACLASGAPHGILTLLRPDWRVLASPAAWLRAAAQVVASLQLGQGALSTFASYNRYHHNIVRDTAVIVACQVSSSTTPPLATE